VKILIVLLASAVGVLAWQSHLQDVALAEQTKHIQELSLSLAAQSKTNSLEQQEKCAVQAERAFKAAGYTPTDHAGYENHYNKALNKCFVVMQSLDIRSTPGSIFTSKTLGDAFEGKEYGAFALQRKKGEQDRQGDLVQCYVTQISGEEKQCNSRGEFDTLADAYMK
jgi:hypothetical protein